MNEYILLVYWTILLQRNILNEVPIFQYSSCQTKPSSLPCSLIFQVCGCWLVQSLFNRTNSKPRAYDTGGPGTGAKLLGPRKREGAKRVSELCPPPPLRTHKTSSVLFDHPPSTHLCHWPRVTQWALAPLRSTHVSFQEKEILTTFLSKLV